MIESSCSIQNASTWPKVASVPELANFTHSAFECLLTFYSRLTTQLSSGGRAESEELTKNQRRGRRQVQRQTV
jgi:hypothetical protein